MKLRHTYRVFLMIMLVGLGILNLRPTTSVNASAFILSYVYYESCTTVNITGLNTDGVSHTVTATVTSAAGTNTNSLLVGSGLTFSLVVSPLSTAGTPSNGTIITVNLDDDEPAHIFTHTFKCSSTGSGSAPCVNSDNRLNSPCGDAAQSVATYCENDGSITVYVISDSKGYFAFRASPGEIAQVPTKPVKNTLIKQNLGAALYRLTSGELQINSTEVGTGKPYSFIFKDCPIP